jgi:putative flippase GtrA
MTLIKSKVSRFLYCGAILTLYAFGLNVLLVEWFHLYKPLSYGIMILSQTALGFLLNRFHVFSKSDFNARSQFFHYSLAAMLFRVSDWMCFTIQVELLSFFYIYAQAFSSTMLVVAKYLVYRRIFDAEIPKSSFCWNRVGKQERENIGVELWWSRKCEAYVKSAWKRVEGEVKQ